MQSYDVIVVGGGHNGLVAAGYLSEAGLRVLVVEGRAQLGGPVARVEFMPGYKTTITNSPGSLEPRIVRDLELERHGLRFVKADPTLVHPLEDGRLFVAWRDKQRTQSQLEAFAPGEAARYEAMHVYLQEFADKLGISLFREPPSLPELVRNLTAPADQEAFGRIFFGSARELMEEFNLAPETQAILAPLTVVAGQVAPSTPGTPFNLMFRPLSLASIGGDTGYDPRRQYLRGSTGQPVGGMSKIVEAMAASAQTRGATLRTEMPVARVLTRDGAVRGIVTADGEEIAAPIVISAINPRLTALELMQDEADWQEIRGKMARRRMRGRAFKLVLALEGLPRYAAAADDAEALQLAGAQFRIAPSIDYVEEAHTDMMLGRISDKPMIWGLCPSVVSPELAPPGCHILSLNIGTAPYKLRDGDWASQRDKLAKLCIDAMARWMPTLPDIIADYRCLDPTDFEREYGIVEGNITHGDVVPWNQFWMRPLPGLHDYRTPTRGLYLSGNGTWPGNFVSGIAGHNTSHAVLADLKSGRIGDQPPQVAAAT
jgi:phytoene dehydrogenase-like protein